MFFVLMEMMDAASFGRRSTAGQGCMGAQVVLHRTIESMLERGEKLDTLVGKSEDLSMASQMFYNQARKTNSCCKLM